jgi:hypothetical protein
MQQGA